MAVPFSPVNMQSMVGPPNPQRQMNPLALLAALNNKPGFGIGAQGPQSAGPEPSPWVNNMLTGPGTTSGPQGQDSLTQTAPPRMEGQGPSSALARIPGGASLAGVPGMGSPSQSGNAPIPGLPQPALQQARGISVGVPDGNPMSSRTGSSTGMPNPGMPPDPGNPPGTSGPSAKILFGYGDDLTTPQLQILQAALTNALQVAQQNNQLFQNARKKPIEGQPAGSGILFRGGKTNTQPVPNPVPQSSPNDPWTGPSSR